jgi:hypothetical protein
MNAEQQRPWQLRAAERLQTVTGFAKKNLFL